MTEKKSRGAFEAFEELQGFFAAIGDMQEKMLEEKYGGKCEDASVFWKNQKKKTFDHICDVPMHKLKSKHKKILDTIHSKIKAIDVGIKLMGDYYQEGFSGRGCSGMMAELVGYGTDYLSFYCASSDYYWMEQEKRLKEESKRK